MNILLLGPLKQKTAKSKRLEPLINFLEKKKYNVFQTNKKISLNFIKTNSINMIICSGYPYKIDVKIIRLLKNRVLNLHPSYLPYGKGVGGLIFCIMKNLPLGITIHLINEKIDSGKIIIQKLVNAKSNESYRKYYLRLLDELNKMFFKEFKNIIENKTKLQNQKIIKNNDFYTRERSEKLYEFFDKSYDISIIELKSFSEKFLINENFFNSLSKIKFKN